jgi:RHS repeat-associated protein
MAQPQFSIAAGVYNNRLGVTQGVVYDNSGNTTTDNMGQIYTWDAESRIASARTTSGTVTYKYDGEGNLVYKTGPSGTFMYYRDAAGRIAFSGTPSGNPGATGTTEAYVDGDLVGNWVNSSFSWVGHDWLGTKRYESTGTGSGSTAVPVFGHSDTSLPFGDATVSTPATDYDPLHFTGKEKDADTGDDYFGARYYSSGMGRFMSPDWAAKAEPVPYAKLDDPQSLNLYSYVRNNPVSGVDPNGHAPFSWGGFEDSTSQPNLQLKWSSQWLANAQIVAAQQKAPKPGRQRDGSYIAPTGPGSEIANITDPAHPLPPMIGNGQCVTACAHFSGVTGDTKQWTEGAPVANNSSIPVGTAIATFGSNGRYPTNGDQNSGIYMGQGKNGSILILDQWPAHARTGTPNHPAQIREMIADDGKTLSNSANSYHVIIVPR